MKWKEPKIEDVASVYPPLRMRLKLSSKHFMEIIEERLTENISPFISVKMVERNEHYALFYNVIVEFFYKGMRYTACSTVRELNTDTLVETYTSLWYEIYKCKEERGYGKTYKEKNRLNAMYGSRIYHQVTKRMFTVKEFKERITKSLHIKYFPQMKVSVEVIDYSLCMYNVEVQFFYKDYYNGVATTVNSLDFCGLVDTYERLCNGIDVHLKECDEEWKNTER